MGTFHDIVIDSLCIGISEGMTTQEVYEYVAYHLSLHI